MMSIAAASLAAAAVVIVAARLADGLWPRRVGGTAALASPSSLLVAVVGRCSRIRRRTRSPEPAEVAVADWCDEAARALRAGSALTVAVEMATAAQPAMGAVVDPLLAAVRRGRALVEALDDAFDETGLAPSSPPGLALTVVRASAELGGPAAAPLERVAATLRTRAAIAEEQLAHSAQARLSAQVLTVVPVALLALLAMTAADIRAALLTVPGLSLLAVGAVLNLVGWRWMQRVIAGAGR